MKIYVVQLLIESLASFFDESNWKNIAEVLMNYIRHKKDQKQSTRPSKTVLIINLLFVFICQAAKKKLKTQEKREEEKEKIYLLRLLSDRSPSLGQINDFTRITFFIFFFFRGPDLFKFRLSLIVLCVFSLLFSNIWLFIVAQWIHETAKSVCNNSFLSFTVNSRESSCVVRVIKFALAFKVSTIFHLYLFKHSVPINRNHLFFTFWPSPSRSFSLDFFFLLFSTNPCVWNVQLL